jgi:hypothetical protein
MNATVKFLAGEEYELAARGRFRHHRRPRSRWKVVFLAFNGKA